MRVNTRELGFWVGESWAKSDLYTYETTRFNDAEVDSGRSRLSVQSFRSTMIFSYMVIL